MSSGAALDPLREIDAAWKSDVRDHLGAARFALWFRDTAVESVSGRSVVLAVPTDVHRTWITYTYGALLATAFGRVLGEGVEVEVRVSAKQDAMRAVRDHLPPDETGWRSCVARTRRHPTLEGFVPDGANGFVVRLLEQMLHGNATLSPPAIVLFGEAGAGKSHLLQAMARAFDARVPGSALYLTARRLTERHVAAMRTKELAAVRAVEVDLDAREVLLIDDLDELATKPQTQLALERWIDRARCTRRRLIVAGRTHPREVEGLSARLESRLRAGVLHRVTVPGPETRAKVLVERGAAAGMRPPDAVIDAILRRESSMTGAVTLFDRWAAVSLRRSAPAPVEWLGQMVPPPSASTPIEEVVRRAKEVVSKYFGTPRDRLDRSAKHPMTVEARRVALYLAHRAAAAPLASLAAAFGWKSHSTAGRAVADVKARRETDPGFEALLDGLLAAL